MELTQQRVYDIRPAEVVAVERDDENLAYLWFADPRQGEVRYVSLARSLSNGSIHAERDDQKWCCYDGITAVELRGGQLLVHFDPTAAGQLGGVELVRVDCQGMNEETLERIEHALRAMFADSGIPLTMS